MLPFIELGGFQVSSYRLMMAAGYLIPTILFWRACRAGVLGERQAGLWLPLSVAGVLAGRLGAGAFSSGLTWHWGFLFATLAVCLLASLLRAPLLKVLDVLAPLVALGYALLRLGCFLAGDGCYGEATDLPWGMAFPNGSKPVSAAVHPAPLYESVVLLLVFLLCESYWKPERDGKIFAAVAILGGFERFVVEFVRLNPEVAWGLTAAQIAGLLLILTGIGTLAWQKRRSNPGRLSFVHHRSEEHAAG